MPVPGAARSPDIGPQLLLPAWLSLLSELATETMLGDVKLAGSNAEPVTSMFTPPFPAANTLRIPAAPAASIAALSDCAIGPGPRGAPQLLLVTRMLIPRFSSATT